MNDLIHLITESALLIKIAICYVVLAIFCSSCSISGKGIDIGYQAIKLRNEAMKIEQNVDRNYANMEVDHE